MQYKSIIICGIVRNAAKNIKKNIPEVKRICSHFAEYQIVIYENDSVDDTKKVLSEWKDSDKCHLHLLMEDVSPEPSVPKPVNKEVNKYFSRARIEKMAKLRNHYLDYVRTLGLSADLLMVIDLDIEKLYPDTIIDALSSNRDWDAICAYGYSISPSLKIRYHDTYALTRLEDRDFVQTENIIYKTNHSFDGFSSKKEWIKVFSAFGGLAIYKFNEIIGCTYFAADNNDSRVEVRCEHYSIYQQMISKGFDKIFVVPSMKLCYQKPSVKLFLKKIKVTFGSINIKSLFSKL